MLVRVLVKDAPHFATPMRSEEHLALAASNEARTASVLLSHTGAEVVCGGFLSLFAM